MIPQRLRLQTTVLLKSECSPQSQSDLCQGLEEVGLVSERVMDQAVAEGDNAMRKVVLRQPSYHPLLLHVWPSCHIDDQIA